MSVTNAAAQAIHPDTSLYPGGVDWSLTRLRDRALDERIVGCVREGDRVLDLGCGDGELLARLKREKGVRERGVEIDGPLVTEAIARGLSVVHGDLEEALLCQADNSFDVVILNQVITNVRDPVVILEESVRVGGRVVVTFPNFAHWRNRLQLLLSGRLPVTPSLPYQWFDTPNIRLATVKDFRVFCRCRRFQIEKVEFVRVGAGGRVRSVGLLPAARATSALFVLSASR